MIKMIHSAASYSSESRTALLLAVAIGVCRYSDLVYTTNRSGGGVPVVRMAMLYPPHHEE
jgi:hypothetical protein